VIAMSGNSKNHEEMPSAPLQIASLMIGGAVFSQFYNDDVNKVPTEAILSRAIDAGANGTLPFHHHHHSHPPFSSVHHTNQTSI
jgi:hypothetical protein